MQLEASKAIYSVITYNFPSVCILPVTLVSIMHFLYLLIMQPNNAFVTDSSAILYMYNALIVNSKRFSYIVVLASCTSEWIAIILKESC